jgi:hypothetical protein
MDRWPSLFVMLTAWSGAFVVVAILFIVSLGDGARRRVRSKPQQRKPTR